MQNTKWQASSVENLETMTAPVNYDSPSALSTLLSSLGLGMRKKYGQNFLINPHVRQRIASLLLAEARQRVWEIGPGIGAMTYEATKLGLHISAFELDPGFATFIEKNFGHIKGFELYKGDFIRTWKLAIEHSSPPDIIFGNLPYNAAGSIIAAIIEGGIMPERMVFTVQKEGALRMTALPSTKNYSAFSVLCQSAYQVRLAFSIPPSAFWPEPNVNSSTVVMEKHVNMIPFAGDKDFTNFTRSCFLSRRKTLLNNLRNAGFNTDDIYSACASIGVEANARAETLTPKLFSDLYTVFFKK